MAKLFSFSFWRHKQEKVKGNLSKLRGNPHLSEVSRTAAPLENFPSPPTLNLFHHHANREEESAQKQMALKT